MWVSGDPRPLAPTWGDRDILVSSHSQHLWNVRTPPSLLLHSNSVPNNSTIDSVHRYTLSMILLTLCYHHCQSYTDILHPLFHLPSPSTTLPSSDYSMCVSCVCVCVELAGLCVFCRSYDDGTARSVCVIQWYPHDTGIFTTSSADKQLKIWDTNELTVSHSSSPLFPSLLSFFPSLSFSIPSFLPLFSVYLLCTMYSFSLKPLSLPLSLPPLPPLPPMRL